MARKVTKKMSLKKKYRNGKERSEKWLDRYEEMESGEFLMLFIYSGILKNIYFSLAASGLSCRHTGSSRGPLSCCDV